MGNPKIWYTPVNGGTVEVIDFSSGAWISQWQDQPSRDAGDVEAISGLSAHSARGTNLDVEFSCEKFADEYIARRILNLQHHLEIGNLCGFSADADKAFAAYANPAPLRGDTTIVTGLPSWHNTAATVAAGDWICLESELPVGAREWVKVATYTALGPTVTITLSSPVTYNHTGATLVRWTNYHPVLRWPVSGRRPLVTSDRQLVWSAACTLRSDRDVAINAFSQGQGVQGGTGNMPPPTRSEDMRTVMGTPKGIRQ